jgi:hypothetical protein
VFGVSGRYRLTSKGAVVAPKGTSAFFGRHPRTIAGTTKDGRIVLVTIDGRRTSSVGVTLAEAAAVAQALGLRDSLNLDGGGSTTMTVKCQLVNTPSGGSQRAVGDALVVLAGPFTPPKPVVTAAAAKTTKTAKSTKTAKTAPTARTAKATKPAPSPTPTATRTAKATATPTAKPKAAATPTPSGATPRSARAAG